MTEKRKIFITGGAGFIGSNLSEFYIKKGIEVIIFDNLSRPGVEYNLENLKNIGGARFIKGDIRDYESLKRVFLENQDITDVFHQAAQVAVTLSVADPYEDFSVNAIGTMNVLEAFRRYIPGANFIYASTNKVYGSLEDLEVEENKTRYIFKDDKYKKGISEWQNLDFHSPYGCSKGAADQYVRDYARIYNLKTLVFRQSCIYGPKQLGIEDQGWVAWFIVRALLGKSINIYGTGKQARDLLYIDDLIAAYEYAIKNIDLTKGRIYNMGGGFENSLSLLEFINFLEELIGKKIDYGFADWRRGDQKIFIADTSLANKDFGWKSAVDWRAGIKNLYNWLFTNKELLDKVYSKIS